MADEVWADAPWFEAYAEVSSHGRVRTKDSERVSRPAGKFKGQTVVQRRKGVMLRPWIARTGYPHIALKVGPKRTKLLVHRLVAKAFVPGWFDGAHVNHINGVKTDNRAENLEWVTAAENTRHQWATGLITAEKLGIATRQRGERGRLLKKDLGNS
jgi:hypothetical protein